MKNAKKTKTGSEHRNSLEVVHVSTTVVRKHMENFFFFGWAWKEIKGLKKKRSQIDDNVMHY
jgi:hypothetical protein